MNSAAQRDRNEVKGWHVLFLFFVIWLGASVMTHYLVPQSLDPTTRWNYRAVIAQTVTAISFAVIVLLSRTLRNFAFEACLKPRRPVSWLEIGASVCLMFLWAFGAHRILVAAAMVYGDTSYWYKSFGFANSTEALRNDQLAFSLLIGVAIAPVLEEFVFRAVMLRAWLQTRSAWLSILLSSLAFGAIHDTGFLFAAGAGVLFAFMYLSYGSIWPVVLVHALHNLIVNTPIVRSEFSLRDPSVVGFWSSWSVEIVLAMLFVPLAIWLFHRLVQSPVFAESAVQTRSITPR